MPLATSSDAVEVGPRTLVFRWFQSGMSDSGSESGIIAVCGGEYDRYLPNKEIPKQC